MDRSIQIKALSGEVRLKILTLLADPEDNFPDQRSANVNEVGVCMSLIAEVIKLSQPTTSRHLDILRQAGFITVTRVEKWAHCKRDDAALREFMSWVAQDLKLQN